MKESDYRRKLAKEKPIENPRPDVTILFRGTDEGSAHMRDITRLRVPGKQLQPKPPRYKFTTKIRFKR